MLNQAIYDFAIWVDGTRGSTLLHESFYMYNWIESTHVLTLMLSLGMLFLIDLRMLGLALTNVPASHIAQRLQWPMLIGFTVMFVTGILLFYAIPIRTSQSLWFRIKFVLLVVAAINALLFHRQMNRSVASWDTQPRAPGRLRVGAGLSLALWAAIVICGRFIAYNWFDCQLEQPQLIRFMAGCIDGQTLFL